MPLKAQMATSMATTFTGSAKKVTPTIRVASITSVNNTLIQNNIIQDGKVAILPTGPGAGNVVAYNVTLTPIPTTAMTSPIFGRATRTGLTTISMKAITQTT